MATGEDSREEQFYVLFLADDDLPDGLAQCLYLVSKSREVYRLSGFNVFFHIQFCLFR